MKNASKVKVHDLKNYYTNSTRRLLHRSGATTMHACMQCKQVKKKYSHAESERERKIQVRNQGEGEPFACVCYKHFLVSVVV